MRAEPSEPLGHRKGAPESNACATSVAVLLVLSLGALVTPATAARGEYHSGKTIRIVVGFAPGGGSDTYARVLARHLGRHVAGQPGVAVENMGGAGSRIAANYGYRVARPDGLP